MLRLCVGLRMWKCLGARELEFTSVVGGVGVDPDGNCHLLADRFADTH